MAISIVFLILLVLVVLVGFLIAGVKGKSENGGGEDMIKKVYLYLVLFATLMMTIGGGVAAFMAIADMVSPAGYYQSFEEYKQYGEKESGQSPDFKKLTDAQLKVKYDAMVSAEKERQIDRATNSLIKSLGWIIIPFPVFIYFQRKLREKEAGAE